MRLPRLNFLTLETTRFLYRGLEGPRLCLGSFRGRRALDASTIRNLPELRDPKRRGNTNIQHERRTYAISALTLGFEGSAVAHAGDDIFLDQDAAIGALPRSMRNMINPVDVGRRLGKTVDRTPLRNHGLGIAHSDGLICTPVPDGDARPGSSMR